MDLLERPSAGTCWTANRVQKLLSDTMQKDKAEVEKMIRNHEWSDFIRKVPVHKGDFFQINPGCVHAIKGGTLILETQQSSDITYRVYDYDGLQTANRDNFM